jgi:transcriptional regulator with XRE-family HTH domain
MASGSKLKAARELKGWTQERMVEEFEAKAEELGYLRGTGISVRQISRWESMDPPPSPRVPQAAVLEALFERPLEALGLRNDEANAGTAWTVESTQAALEAAVYIADGLNRRALLERTGGALRSYLFTWLASGPQLERWVASDDERLPPSVIAQLEDKADQLRYLDAEFGGAAYRNKARELLAVCLRLTKQGRFDRNLGRRLFAVTADVATLAGWFEFDAGAPLAADPFFDAALRASHAAEDHLLGSYVASFMAIRHYAAGESDDAIALAQGAQVRLDPTRFPHVMTMLKLSEARSHAAGGHGRETYGAIDSALEHFGRGPSPEEPEWLYWMSEGELLGQAGSSALELGDLDKAGSFFADAAHHYGSHSNRSESLHAVRRSIALARAGMIDEACAVITDTLGTSAPVQSRRFSSHLHEFESEVAPIADAPVVREALDSVRAASDAA